MQVNDGKSTGNTNTKTQSTDNNRLHKNLTIGSCICHDTQRRKTWSAC